MSEGRLSTGTITSAVPRLSERELDALVALCAGYLAPFPRRREHPATYAEAAASLGAGWTPDAVRKAVERVKARFAAHHQLYFEGPRANYELAAHLIANAVVTAADLSRLKSAGR